MWLCVVFFEVVESDVVDEVVFVELVLGLGFGNVEYVEDVVCGKFVDYFGIGFVSCV